MTGCSGMRPSVPGSWSEVKWSYQIVRTNPWTVFEPRRHGLRRRTLTACPPSSPRACGRGTCWRWCWSRAAVLLGVWQLDAWQTRRADEARDLTQAEPVAAEPT